ncbi:MAG TPA: hypothetical protein VL053_19060, partial [Arachidicoccus sp.]|nr:hypothetical protein [Arachidicoccus sp.]
MDNFNTHKILNANTVFSDYFIDGKAFYLYTFNTLPNVNFVKGVDGEKILEAIKVNLQEDIQRIYQRRWYKRERKQFQFDKTLIVLSSKIVIDLSETHVFILHDGKHLEPFERLLSVITQFKKRERKEPREINIIIQNSYGLDLKPMEIKSTKLDLDLFYEDDFKVVDEVIQERLKK